MRVAVTGSGGFVGRALTARLEDEGHYVIRLLRTGSRPVKRSAYWDPGAGTIDSGALEGVDRVIHLAGANIGVRPWTEGYKEKILRSRVEGTRLVAETLAGLNRPPAVLVSASAIGWYGDRGEEILTEQSAPGAGFRAEVCRQWEAAAQPAAGAGIRLATVRFGIVLEAGGGFLEPFMLPARMGVRIQFGSGAQFVSWITLEDTVRAVCAVAANDTVAGPVNLTAPEPVTNAEFARELSRVLGRSGVGYFPRAALELGAGRERAREVLLSSQRALPTKLMAAGFTFQHPQIAGALRWATTARA